MAFPQDLDNVVVFKIHPAIGIARVSKSDKYFIFGQQPDTYKSDDNLIKRQAVQFRVFAYGENHVGLGELTPTVMAELGITPVWSARVANRKIAFIEGVPLSAQDHVISAEATSDDENKGYLAGSLEDFDEGADIPLGQITPEGIFIPPTGGVFRKSPGLPIPPFPSHTNEIADTSSDGSIGCTLNGIEAPPVLPACIIVAPADFSPDVNPIPNPNAALLEHLQQEVLSSSSTASGTLHNQTARELDEAALRPCTSRAIPGYEVSIGSRSEIADLKSVFYNSNDDPLIDPRELRIRYKEGAADPGATLGQLTSGLCSPWQTDFTACTGFWHENLPVEVFLDENAQVDVDLYRKNYDDTGTFPPPDRLTTGDDYDRHVDKVGVARMIDSKLTETERDPGDDIIDAGV